MSAPENNLSEWNPMANEYNNESWFKYDGINSENSNIKNEKHPYLNIKKNNIFITENMLKNYFGSDLIYDIEYIHNQRLYRVYFHNFGSLEAAWTKVHGMPNVLNCVQSRPPRITAVSHVEDKEIPPPRRQSFTEEDIIDLDRTILISKPKSKQPEFHKPPLVIKADYTSKNSVLAVNDAKRRYLNVRYEFSLEHHGVYSLSRIVEEEQTIYHFRSGRISYTPINQLEEAKDDMESELNQIASKCLYCSCYTDCCCKHCKMYFCNRVCYDALSAAHMQSCDTGEPPIIDAIADEFNTFQLPPSGTVVKITSFEQSNVMYVRPTDSHTELAYYKILTDVSKWGKDAPKLTKLPQPGQVVIYKINEDILRAMVLNVDCPQFIYVVCVDYGSVEITSLDNLYECSAYLASLPRYATPVKLRGVPKRYMCVKLRGILYEFNKNYTFLMKYSERDYDFNKCIQRVVLVDTDMNRNLNRIIMTIIKPIEPNDSHLGFEETYLQHVYINPGNNIKLVVMDNTFIKNGVIHCTILDFAYEITQMQRDYQYYAENVVKSRSYAPTYDTLCIAKFQGKWYRGRCLELMGDAYPSILFIDYGNINPIHIDDIRPYSEQFVYPILTTEYELIGLPTNPSDELVALLEEQLAVSSIIDCREVIYNKDHNNYSLRLDIVEKLSMQTTKK